MFGRGVSKMSYFVQVGDFVKRWHLQKIPTCQKYCKEFGFGDFSENSKSSTNFQNSEDVHEDLISSLG